jgi:hypothetical protein
MKNSIDTIGDLTSDHPACNKASQPTGPPASVPRISWCFILKFILRKWAGMAWTGLNWLEVGTGGGLFQK